MSTQLHPSGVASLPAPVPHRHRRRNAAVAGLVAVLAAGSYATTQTIESTPAPETAPVSRAEGIAQNRQTIEALYGPRPATPTADPRERSTAQNRQTIEALYGPRPATATTDRREPAVAQNAKTIQALYGPQGAR